jgi:hypothetical protein
MPRKFLRRFLPDHHSVRNHKHLQFMGEWLHDPNLWHLNRRSVAGAFAVGLFMAFVPIPLQMIPSALFAVLLRVNLPISVALVWITNPLTSAPVFYFAYKLGGWVLGETPPAVAFEASFTWLLSQIEVIWRPFLLGTLMVSLASAALGYFGVRLLWRMHIVKRWRDKRRGQINS